MPAIGAYEVQAHAVHHVPDNTHLKLIEVDQMIKVDESYWVVVEPTSVFDVLFDVDDCNDIFMLRLRSQREKQTVEKKEGKLQRGKILPVEGFRFLFS